MTMNANQIIENIQIVENKIGELEHEKSELIEALNKLLPVSIRVQQE